MKNNKGFSLVELMVVIALIGVLTLIAIAVYPSLTTRAATRTCQANRYHVIRAFQRLRYGDETLTLEEVLADDTGKYFAEKVECPEGGVLSVEDGTIVCSIHGSTLIDANSSASYKYDFSNMTAEEIEQLLDVVITHDRDDWVVVETDGRLVLTNESTGENRIFFPLDLEEYTIISNIQLDGSNGYGIMVESVTDENARDSGFIFQYDPGYGGGEFIFRERNNGGEYSPFARIKPEDVIPDYDSDTFWNEEHEIEIDVYEYNETQNRMVVRIDGVDITVDDMILVDKADNDAENYMGFRTWGSSHALIEDLEIIAYGDD